MRRVELIYIDLFNEIIDYLTSSTRPDINALIA